MDPPPGSNRVNQFTVCRDFSKLPVAPVKKVEEHKHGLFLISGVARSLLLGGQSASVASRNGGSGSLPPEKFFGATPLRCSENEGNALFSYILHHKREYIEHKIGRMFCSIWIKLLRKQKNSYAITSGPTYQGRNTKWIFSALLQNDLVLVVRS